MRFYIFCFLLLFITASTSAQENLIYTKVKLHLHNHNLKEVAALGLESDHGSHAHHKHLINVYNQKELKLLREAGIGYDVIIEDVQKFYDQYGTTDQDYVSVSSRNQNCDDDATTIDPYTTPQNYVYGSMGGYLTYDEALTEMDKMTELYPNLITARTAIGDIVTQENRELYYMAISNTPGNIDTEKPQILYNSLHHAREPNSLSQNIFYMWYLLENYGTDEEITYLVDNVTMFFFPIVNPDGYVYNETTNPNGGGFWRKNRYVNPQGDAVGVDLNRNYGFFWGFDNQGSSNDENNETYRGTSAFSEPETQAMRQLFLENNFKIALNYHTFGNLLIHPWGYSDEPTDEDVAFKSLGRVMTTENDFLIGTGSETVGYVVNGDSDDWMYGEQTEKEKAYSLTPEVGPSFWPGEAQIDGLNKSSLRQNLIAAHLLLNFAWAREISAAAELTSLSGDLNFQLEKSGLRDDLISFSVISETAGLTMANNNYPDLSMTIGEMMDFTVSYTLDPGFAQTEINIAMLIDNGNYIHRIPISKTFNAASEDPDESIVENIENGDNFTFEGSWNVTNEDFVSAPFSITDSPNGNYNNNVNSEIVLINTINLMVADSAYFKFQTKFEIENDYDFVQLLVSTDGINYQAMCGNYTNPAVPDQLSDESPLYDGFQSEWVEETICLNDFVGNENVFIKYLFVSDQGLREDGFYFDDLVVDIYKGITKTSDVINLSNVRIAPNPSRDIIQVSINNFSNAVDFTFDIISLSGQVIRYGSLNDVNTVIDVESINSGAYYIRVKGNGNVLSHTKWIKL